jgi:hypothetical protein
MRAAGWQLISACVIRALMNNEDNEEKDFLQKILRWGWAFFGPNLAYISE